MARAQLIEIDLRNISSSEELHSLLMEALGFPSWYGCNWDAFWDAVTGLVEMPLKLKLIGWQDFSLRLPRDARIMKECFTDMEFQFPRFASEVLYV
ncbi:barstar family protein [Propionivibrio soli]|uniref:barstar family protein n=1 Tax=Propionivibrio soli TaxID=2976531 RepID=UPI0021E77270|nr:barstar family protein [Propionivibrio soli]